MEFKAVVYGECEDEFDETIAYCLKKDLISLGWNIDVVLAEKNKLIKENKKDA